MPGNAANGDCASMCIYMLFNYTKPYEIGASRNLHACTVISVEDLEGMR